MNLTRPLIFALLFYLLCPFAVALAEEASSDAAIVRASQSHLGAARASADFQKSESQLAAESLMRAIQKSETSEPAAVAEIPAAPVVAPAIAHAPKPAFTVTNDLLPQRAQRVTTFQKASPSALRKAISYNN